MASQDWSNKKMAEGGEDFPLGPLDPNGGEDDHNDDEHETSFGGIDWDTQHRSPGGGGSLASGSSHHFNPGYEPDEETRPLIDPVERLVSNKEKAEDFLKSVFVDSQLDQILCGVDDYDRVWVSLTGKRATKYVHQPSGRFLSQMPKSLMRLLGQTNEQALERNDQIMQQSREDLTRLRASHERERLRQLGVENESLAEQPSEVDRERMRQNNDQVERLRCKTGATDEQIQRLEAVVERLEEQNEEICSRMSLRDKVKYIFKKYGLTVFGVLAAVGTVIGVIVSNPKAGLTNVTKGVGNGLKELGKKLGQILPGMVGPIVSFLFKAAGEAVGFLAKHAWLPIMLVVTFAVEQFKRRLRRQKK